MSTINLGRVEQIPLGEGRAFQVGVERVAVFRPRDGGLFATEAVCPHRQGPLADGLVGGGKVYCPLHGFAFDLTSGRCLNSASAGARTFRVSLSPEGDILLGAPGANGSPKTSGSLAGRRVALLEARLASEAAALVRRLGGLPVS
ncbi:MAG TPA: Rieske 2Fe-2S domain-containing protein, partial [Vicinamibacteria bacterium]